MDAPGSMAEDDAARSGSMGESDDDLAESNGVSYAEPPAASASAEADD